MVRNCFVLSCLVTSAVLTAGVVRGGSIDPNRPPEGRFSDEWSEVYMSGAKVGYSHSTMSREGDLIHTGTTVVMEIARERQKVALRTEEQTTETLTGVPLSFESTMDMSMMKTALRGKVKDGKVTIVQAQFGMEQTQTFDYPPGALMTWGAFRESLLRGFKPGTEYVLSIYAPQLRLDDALRATTRVGDAEEFEHRNKKLRGQKVTVVMESPMGSMELISWIDQGGRSLKALLPAPGLGNLELITTDQATALADFVPPELFLTTVVEAKGKVDPKSARRIKYRIIARNGEVDLGELPTTGAQILGERTERSVEVIVTRERRWAAVLLALFGASLAYAALGPADWQVRLGLHWLIEHFLGFFVLTLLACRVYPRPLRVAAVLLPVAVGLEAAQALTPDRMADVATALVAAAAVASAALLADAVLFWRKRREDV